MTNISMYWCCKQTYHSTSLQPIIFSWFPKPKMLFSIKFIPCVLLSSTVYLKTHKRWHTIPLFSSFKQQLSFLVQNISHSIFLINALSLDKCSTIKRSELDSASQNSILPQRSSSDSLMSWVPQDPGTRQATVAQRIPLLLWLSFLIEHL